MTSLFDFPSPQLGEITLIEPLEEEQIKRLPPLFYHEDEALESELLILKLVSTENPNQQVYLYEHDGISLFSAMLVADNSGTVEVSFDLVSLAVSSNPLFRVVGVFKPMTVHELITEFEFGGSKVVVVDAQKLIRDFGLGDA